jgi:hypothetical protein
MSQAGIFATGGGGGGGANSFPTDFGTATPVGGVLNIITNNSAIISGSTVFFQGIGNTVQLLLTDGNLNSVIGANSGNLSITGQRNASFGQGNALGLSSGNSNVFLGSQVGQSLASGSFNVLIGSSAGLSYNGGESSNISINSNGINGESNVLRIGGATGTANKQLNQSFIAGIYGITPATADGIPVYIGSDGQLGTVGTGGAGGVTSVITDTGTANPAGGVLNVIANTATLNAGSSVSFSGTGNTVQLNVTDALHNIIIGMGSGNASITGQRNIGLGYTCATAAGTGNDNIMVGFQTGNSLSNARNNVMIGSNTGFSLTGGNGNVLVGGSVGSSINTGSNNVIIGLNAGGSIDLGGSNIIIGPNAGTSLTSSNSNVLVGPNCGASLVSGTLNVMMGSNSGISLSSGDHNTFYGANTANSLGTGQNNIVIGYNAGTSYASSESSNILIGSIGTAGDANVLTIGAGTGTGTAQINKAFISGIRGITPVTNDGIAVFIGSAGQLGTIVSSRNVKNTIEDMGDTSSSVLNLRPVTFLYNGDVSEKKQYGLIAEEVNEIFPDIVAKNKDGEIETVLYHLLPVLLLNEMKKQNELINSLIERIQILEKSNE